MGPYCIGILPSLEDRGSLWLAFTKDNSTLFTVPVSCMAAVRIVSCIPSPLYYCLAWRLLGPLRLVVLVQIMSSAIGLSSRFLRIHWRPVAILLGPALLLSWLTCSLLIRTLLPCPLRDALNSGRLHYTN